MTNNRIDRRKRTGSMRRAAWLLAALLLWGGFTDSLTAAPAHQAENPAPPIPYLVEKETTGATRSPDVYDYHFSRPQTPVRGAGVAATAAILSDDFNRANLDPSDWTLVDPVGDGAIRLTGAGTGAARLDLILPPGPTHDPWNTNRALRVMQRVGDGDFQLDIKFDSVPDVPLQSPRIYQMQGLIVEQDQDNWLRLELQHDGSELRLVAIATVNGASAVKASQTVRRGGTAYLRLTRSGDRWTLDYSDNGTDWLSDDRPSSALAFSQAMTMNAIGPYAANHIDGAGVAPAFTAQVDYLSSLSSPIGDEDASARADTSPPLVHGVKAGSMAGGATVNWNSDEPAAGLVEYGLTPAYGMSQDTSGSAYDQAVRLTGLTPGMTYHYRVKSTDAGNRTTTTAGGTFVYDPAAGDGPTIDVWYGDRQNVDLLGRPQIWFNVLGNVDDFDGVVDLAYAVNGGGLVAAAIGPDGQRLENSGDFNLELRLPIRSGERYDGVSEALQVPVLQVGENQVVIQARDSLGNLSTKTMTVVVGTGGPWPAAYRVDWATMATSSAIQDFAQVVDGKWDVVGDMVRTTEPGYDRLIAIGDVSWADFEVTVPVIIHSEPYATDRGLGILLRWIGHTDSPPLSGECSRPRPKCGWQPVGALAWYHNLRMELYSYDSAVCDTNLCTRILGTPSNFRTLTPGVTYWLKARVQTSGDAGSYAFKVWEDGRPEPSGWDTSGVAKSEALANGSLLLLSHRIDASFGLVDIQPLDVAANTPPTAGDDSATVTKGSSQSIDVLANDTDVDGTLNPTSVQIVSEPVRGTATVNPISGVITYAHDGMTSQPDTFTYTVDDNLGATSNVATISVTIQEDGDNTPPVITLDGDNPYLLELGTPYVEPGATAEDDTDGELTDEIVIGGDIIDPQIVGEYFITYDVSDAAGNTAQLTRTVQVVDVIPPVIVLIPAETLLHEAGTPYDEESGVSVLDNYDAVVPIAIGGQVVDPATPGDYMVTYNAVDSSGNQAEQVMRTVRVVDRTAPALVLLGDNPLVLEIGTDFQEQDPGATASDTVDGELTETIQVDTRSLNQNAAGAYSVSYSVVDSSGNQTVRFRTVRVVDKPAVIFLPYIVRE